MCEPLIRTYETVIGNVDAGMKTVKYGRPLFKIVCTVEVPYPKKYIYNERATAIGTAINRAVIKTRKELRGRKIDGIKFKATKLTN